MAKYAAFGTLLQIGDGADPENFTTIAGVRTINLALSTDTVDVTAHDSPGGFEEIVPTIKRSGDTAIEMVFDPADTQQTALKAAYDNKTLDNYQIVYPDAANTTDSFAAYIIGYETNAPYDGALTNNVTLKPTGAVTRA